MRYWLIKSEPDTYAIEDLRRDGATLWDGVRSYMARNHLREMAPGDLALFYHSNAKPSGVAGIARVRAPARPDPTAFDPEDDHYDPESDPAAPRWFAPEVAFERAARALIPLETLKATPGLEGMVLFRNSRLSVQPVTPEEWKVVTGLPELHARAGAPAAGRAGKAAGAAREKGKKSGGAARPAKRRRAP